MSGGRPNRRSSLQLVIALVVSLVLIPGQIALATYSRQSQTVYTSTAAPEATELADLVPSPRYPDWYWSVSDVWKTTDDFAACAYLEQPALNECQQVQRARLWAFKLDPVTHKIVDVRSFAVSDPTWALEPYIAQNNDWEDMTLGPLREQPDGTTAENLIIGATGNARANPVRDDNGADITCSTRRLIEVPEPDLGDPTADVWAPWKIYDIKNVVSKYGAVTCNIESLVQAPDASDGPTAYLVSRSGGKILSRSLDASTGRDPTAPPAVAGSGSSYEPSVTFVGTVAGSSGRLFTGADTNGRDVALVSPGSSKKPCQIFSWTMGESSTLATTITSSLPVKDTIACRSTEGVTYTRAPSDPSAFTRDLYTVADLSVGLRYWFIPATNEPS